MPKNYISCKKHKKKVFHVEFRVEQNLWHFVVLIHVLECLLFFKFAFKSLSSDQENSALKHYFQLVVVFCVEEKPPTENKKPPTSFMSWYMVEYGQDSQTKVGAEREQM